MLWGPALASWLCKRQKGESSTRCPPTVLNPSETNREQKGDEPYCPDHQNTNIGEEEKERDLEKNAGAAQLLTIVIGASAVGLAVHEKRDSSTSTVSAAGREDPHHFSPPPTALP
jgi:hypothetical protein